MNNQANQSVLLITLNEHELSVSNVNVDVLNLHAEMEHAAIQLEHYLKTHVGFELIILSLGENAHHLLEQLINVIHHNTHKTYIGVHQKGEELGAVIDRLKSKFVI